MEDTNKKIHPEIKLTLVKNIRFFGPGTAQLLSLIGETNSVRLACVRMGLSYSKAWRMIANMESQLGYAVIIRKQGGKNGGGAELTSKAVDLLEKYLEFEKSANSSVQKIFLDIFE